MPTEQSVPIDLPLVSFEELFAPEDTIRLDSGVIVGRVDLLDINDSGELLVADGVSNNFVLFSDEGEHIRTYDLSTCLPGARITQPSVAQFLPEDRLLLAQWAATAIVNRDGTCVASKVRLLPNVSAGCVHGDTIFMYSARESRDRAVWVYNDSLESLSKVPIAKTEHVYLNERGLGQSIGCFKDGPYHVYMESMDAKSVYFPGKTRTHRPSWHKVRTEIIPYGSDLDTFLEGITGYPNLSAIYPLTPHVRLLRWFRINRGLPPGILSDHTSGIGIISNTEAFQPRSAILPVRMVMAKDGHLYEVGDYEQLPDGEIGNQQLIRHRFIQPTTDE